jgi:hypothetical protein
MYSLNSVFVLLAVLALGQAFAPATRTAVGSCTTTTQLQMGLFDKPKPKKTPPKKEGGFLEGRGAKITIREDEDNAMWIEEPDDKKKKKGK